MRASRRRIENCPACSAGREAHPYCGCQVGRAPSGPRFITTRSDINSADVWFNPRAYRIALRTRRTVRSMSSRARVLGVSARQGRHQDLHAGAESARNCVK